MILVKNYAKGLLGFLKTLTTYFTHSTRLQSQGLKVIIHLIHSAHLHKETFDISTLHTCIYILVLSNDSSQLITSKIFFVYMCVCLYVRTYVYIYIYMGCNGSQNSGFNTTQWCHGLVCFRWGGGGGGGNWICRNVGNISVLNHEGEPILIIGL